MNAEQTAKLAALAGTIEAIEPGAWDRTRLDVLHAARSRARVELYRLDDLIATVERQAAARTQAREEVE